jgi:pyruvate ferredoxin oxidoreductase alpha subunit
VIDQYRDEGKTIGLLKIKAFRPFPSEEVRKELKGIPKVAVIDRNISYGVGGIFAAELKSAPCNEEDRPMVFSYVAGLG